MTAPAGRRAAAITASEWRVEIEMPVHVDGRDRGKPVGWLTLNKIQGGVWGAIGRWRAAKAWRIAAYDAYKRAKLPRGLRCVYVEVEFRFPDRTRRDLPNFELTVKPVIDALQPEKSGMRYNPHLKRKAPFVDKGWGVIPGDDRRYLIRGPELPPGEPLGRQNPIKGMIILHITHLPEVDST